MLSSIGMNKKQKNVMIRKEARILGIIGIPIGILLGLGFARVIIYILNALISKTVNDIFSIFTFDSSIEIYIKISLLMLLISAVIVYIIIFISSILPMKKLNKLSPIDAIRNTQKFKITAKQVKTPKFIEKTFGEEGVIAYKNIRRDKTRYKTIVISIAISIILFLTISGFISNFYGNKINSYYASDYIISMPRMEAVNYQENKNALLDLLNKSELVNDYFIMEQMSGTRGVYLREGIVTEEFSKLNQQVEDNEYQEDESIFVGVRTFAIYDDAYKDLLSRAGISELKDGEVILVDRISEDTKYGKNIRITNFKVGDTYTTSTMLGKKDTFKIVEILDNFEPYISQISVESVDRCIYQIVNERTMEEFSKKNLVMTSIYIDTDDPFEMDTLIKNFNEKNGATGISGYNAFEHRVSEENQQTITKIIAYSFVGFISLVTVVNIFNTIYSSILLRKKDFAVLKSMRNEQ